MLVSLLRLSSPQRLYVVLLRSRLTETRSLSLNRFPVPVKGKLLWQLCGIVCVFSRVVAILASTVLYARFCAAMQEKVFGDKLRLVLFD